MRYASKSLPSLLSAVSCRFEWIRVDSGGFVWIRGGFGWIWVDSGWIRGGFGWIWVNSGGFGWFHVLVLTVVKTVLKYVYVGCKVFTYFYCLDRRSWMIGDEQSLQNIYQDNQEVAKYFGRIVYKIVKHSHFKPDDFQKYDLHLCEAYCLLWQNAETGSVSGRKLGIPLKIGLFAALFIDLCAANRLDIFRKENVAEPMFRITDLHATDTFLDSAIFDTMRKANSHGRLREAKLMSWLERAEEAECVDNTFDSLVAKGILKEKTTGLLGTCKRFPTVDPTPENVLESKIKDIAFKRESPDSFMEALLVLSRESDQIFMCSDPILRKHFTCAEYVQAKKNLDQMFNSYTV